MQHIKQDKANVTTVAQPGPGHPRKPPTSANDNDCEGSWSRPFPAGSATIQLTRVSDTKKRPPCRQTSFRSSWSGTLSSSDICDGSVGCDARLDVSSLVRLTHLRADDTRLIPVEKLRTTPPSLAQRPTLGSPCGNDLPEKMSPRAWIEI